MSLSRSYCAGRGCRSISLDRVLDQVLRIQLADAVVLDEREHAVEVSELLIGARLAFGEGPTPEEPTERAADGDDEDAQDQVSDGRVGSLKLLLERMRSHRNYRWASPGGKTRPRILASLTRSGPGSRLRIREPRMFGSIGGPELPLIFVLALLLFGPRKLPEIGRTIGKTIAEFKRATNEFTSSLEREVELEKLKDLGASMKNPDRSRGIRHRARPALLGTIAMDTATARQRSGEGLPRQPRGPRPAPMAPSEAASQRNDVASSSTSTRLRSRLVRCIVVYIAVFAGRWYWSGPLLRFLLRPMQDHSRQGRRETSSTSP